MSQQMHNIGTIAAGLPFAKILAEILLDETKNQPESLGRYLVLLPTRRACRVLQDAFLQMADGQSLVLPRLQPIGDLDEEELSLSLFGHESSQQLENLSAPISPLRRQILLAKLIARAYPDRTPEQNTALARALGHLMDQIYTENLDLADLVTLVPEDLANHWQITLKFLEILSVEWPKILADEGAIDAADRRNRLILALAEFWQKQPPVYPVIAAGTTGSIPATAALLKTVAGLAQGRVILPGFEPDLDQESWDALDETHPQFGFKHLLAQLDIPRIAVEILAPEKWAPRHQARHFLVQEMMRPAATSQSWAKLRDNPKICQKLASGLEGLFLLPCENQQEEAAVIAALLRENLETPNRHACVITPDRRLAQRVTMACRRWNIDVDDSAGSTLKNSVLGVFMRLALQVIKEDFTPTSFLALLKHNLSACAMKPEDYHRFVEMLDFALRGPKPAPGLDGLQDYVAAHEKLSLAQKKLLHDGLQKLQNIFSDFMPPSKSDFTVLLRAHIKLCETLAAAKEPNNQTLWQGPEGQKIAEFLAKLLEEGASIGTIEFDEYPGLLEHFMDQEILRPAFGTHPRLQILGQLEARLVDADLVILAGLNEGSWPPDPGNDPWMSRPMRKKFGLPSPERHVGLAAHDFVQGLCNPQVVITRSKRIDGAPSVPARWLQRLDAIMSAANMNHTTLEKTQIMDWVRAIDTTKEPPQPAQRPAPTPPLTARPRQLSVTRIETWMKDPYAIYARGILRLKKLDPLERPIDAAMLGNLLHKIFERLINATKDALPKDSDKMLHKIAEEELENLHNDPAIWSFWWPRFARIADWFIKQEQGWRTQARPLTTEAQGAITLKSAAGDFNLTGKADRIDLYHQGGTAIIDYKSGGNYTEKSMRSGDLPQLPLEALMLEQGGFSSIAGGHKPASLQYWKLSAGREKKKITALETGIEIVIAETHAGLQSLIEAYDDPAMPYTSLPYPDKAPRYNDYEHLARIHEWRVANDLDNDEEAA